MAEIRLTDEQWRDFQNIPDQGYSHRAWIDHKLAQAEARGAARAAEAIALAIETGCCHFMGLYRGKPECCGYCEDAARIARAALAESEGA